MCSCAYKQRCRFAYGMGNKNSGSICDIAYCFCCFITFAMCHCLGLLLLSLLFYHTGIAIIVSFL